MMKGVRCLCILPIVLCCGLLGCVGTPGEAYIKADRQTWGVARIYLSEYAADHPARAPAVSDLVQGWDIRLRAAERSQASTAPAH